MFDVGLDKTLIRQQFPVCMAFAVTAHKCQGLTVNTALISTHKMFAPGQAFVAFSRIRKLEGLHLVDFLPSKILCDAESLNEYNRLRGLQNMSQLDVPETSKQPPTTKNAQTAQVPPLLVSIY